MGIYLLACTDIDSVRIQDSSSVPRSRRSSRRCKPVSELNTIRCNQEPRLPMNPTGQGREAALHPRWAGASPYSLLAYCGQLCQLYRPGYCRCWTYQRASRRAHRGWKKSRPGARRAPRNTQQRSQVRKEVYHSKIKQVKICKGERWITCAVRKKGNT